MKKLLPASAALVALVAGRSAMAADLPVRAPVQRAPPVVAPAYKWTGFYVGGHGGWARTAKTWVLGGLQVADYSAGGFIGGGQVGYNWRSGNWVLGVEAQASWGSIRKGVLWIDPNPNPASPFWTDPEPNPADPTGRVSRPRTGTTVEHLGSIAGRLGYPSGRVLLFAKGGGAWAHDVYRAFNGDQTPEHLLATASGTRWGWMAGVGVEYGVAQNWSAKLAVDYFDVGRERITLVGLPVVTPATRDFDIEQSIMLVKVGISYRFGGR